MPVTIIMKTEQTAQELAMNVAIMAHCLEQKGVKIEDIDKAVEDCRKYIENRVEEMGIKDPALAFNVENEVIMALMLESLKLSILNTKEIAKRDGVPEDVYNAEVIADMEAMLNQDRK